MEARENSNASLNPQGDGQQRASNPCEEPSPEPDQFFFMIGSLKISSNNSKNPWAFLVLHRSREIRFKETSIGLFLYYALRDSSFAIRADGGAGGRLVGALGPRRL